MKHGEDIQMGFTAEELEVLKTALGEYDKITKDDATKRIIQDLYSYIQTKLK
jgi:hypothetical protein